MGILADLRLRSSGLLGVPGMSILSDPSINPQDNYVAANATRLLFVNFQSAGRHTRRDLPSYLVEPGEVWRLATIWLAPILLPSFLKGIKRLDE